ncbi:MAG: sodium:calcium antiporter [Armatimonadetes bacterium]|nr:sodium:calcium antiporter [Armatimonadota bacterium]
MKLVLLKNWLYLFGAAFLPLPWIILKFSAYHNHQILITFLSGFAIIGAAFLLSWIAEVAQLDISQSLALAMVALIAILPEYAVDMYFAWNAAKKVGYGAYAAANMTGSNRLIIGAAWAAVVFFYYWKSKNKTVVLEKSNRLELSFLILSTLYSFIIFFKRNLALIDTVILGGLFVLYIYLAAKSHQEEPELEGPAEAIAGLGKNKRRILSLLLFLYAGFSIFISAEPFAEGLIHTGKILKIEEFLLIQWLAPLASEAPEFIVAVLFALRLKPSLGLGALISAKINQWTLLVGMIPLVFSLSAGKILALPLYSRQVEEFFLTSAQSAFAIMIISNLQISLWEALIIFFLFITQIFFTTPFSRHIYSLIYILFSLIILLKSKTGRKNIKDSIFGLFKR